MNRTDRFRQSDLSEEVNDLYHYTLELLEDNDHNLEITLADSPLQQLHWMRQVVEKLAFKAECEECGVYEKQLQKLEADIRQHIKLQHQLKLYQDSLEEKATESKKQHTGLEKEIANYKKRIEELREIKIINTDQISKLQAENQDLKNEVKSFKVKKVVKREDASLVDRTHSIEKRQIAKRLEARTLLIDRAPLTKTINFNSNDERKSIEKTKGISMTDDMSKQRQSLNNKSSQMLRSQGDRKKFEILMRDKENEKRKINKIEYRK